MKNPLFDLSITAIYVDEKEKNVEYSSLEKYNVIYRIISGVAAYCYNHCEPLFVREDNPKKYKEIHNNIPNKNNSKGFPNDNDYFIIEDEVYSLQQAIDKPFVIESYKTNKEYYPSFFVLKLNHLDIYQIKDFLSYHYQSFDGDYISFLEIIIENEGKIFWNDNQINIVKSWLQNPTKPQLSPTIIDEVFHLGKDVTRIKRNFIKSLDYLHNKQVFRKLLKFGIQNIEVQIKDYKHILDELERRCSIFEKNIDAITHELKKAKLQSLKDENCKKCEYYNLLLEDKEDLLEVLKECEYDEIAENHLLEAWIKLIEEIKISLNSEKTIFSISYGIIIWVELGYAYQTGDSVFLEYLMDNFQNPLLMVRDTNVFMDSHTKYLTNKLAGTNEDTGFNKIKNELIPIYKQIQSNDFDLLFAASIRQTEPKELKAFLTYHYNKYEGDFNEFLETCLMVYEQYINPVNIKIANQWLLIEKPNSQKTTPKINNKPPEGFRLIPIGTKTQEDIKHFFSFLYEETNGDDKPFMSKVDVEEILQFGFGVYKEPIKHYAVNVHRPKGIIKYCFFKLYSKLDIRNNKNDIAIFLTQNFECFKKDHNNLDNFKRQMTNDKPKTMIFDIEQYLPK